MNDANQIYAQFRDPLWADVADENDFPAKRPLLAHYTAMSTLECILKNEELWLANPLFMNDMEELRFGLNEAADAFRLHSGIEEACGGKGARYNALCDVFEQQMSSLSNEDAFDTYCLCFSLHDEDDNDGRLSMWRGYGGNGSGAAIVFDTHRIPEYDASPLVLAQVHYATTADRLRWIQDKLDQFAALLRSIEVPVPMFYLPMHALLQRFKLFALYTKHKGFEEEREWRMVYIKDRDREGKLAHMFHYHIQNNRVEPKLKFKVEGISGVTGGPIVLHDLIDRIILGPSASSLISIASMKRMLRILGKDDLCTKIQASSTPYRPV